MLELKNVSKTYGGKGVQTCALRGVSIRFPARGMVFVVGKSGCGKSTLLHVLGGLDRADEGELIVDGASSKRFRPADYDRYRNEKVGFVFQEYNLFENFTVRANVQLALDLQNKRAAAGGIDGILAEVDLREKAEQKASTLSGGEKQRVAIARALVKDPQIVLADEPTGALDAASGDQVMALLKKLSRDRLVVVVSHDEERAARYADRIIRMRDGAVIEDVALSAPPCGAENIAEGSAAQAAAYEGAAAESAAAKAVAETAAPPSGRSAHLPVRHALRLGLHSVKARPVRLAFTIFLSFVAFLCFAMLSTSLFYDEQRTAAQTISAAERTYLQTSKAYVREQMCYRAGELESVTEQTLATGYTAAEVQALAQTYPGSVAVVKLSDSASIDGLSLSQQQDYFYQDDVRGLALVSDSMQWLAGDAPRSADEIAVSDFLFEAFEVGTWEVGGEAVEVGGYADLIGREIELHKGGTAVRFTVSGVFAGARVPEEYAQLREDVRGGDIWETPDECYGWWEVRASGLYAVAALTEDGLARSAPLVEVCCRSDVNEFDRFLHNPNGVALRLAQSGQSETAGAEYNRVAPYADCTGNGVCEVYSLAGEPLAALEEGSVGIRAFEYANLVDWLFDDYFAAAGESAAVDRAEYDAVNIDLFNEVGGVQGVLENLARLREMMARCSIAEPAVLLEGANGESYTASIAGIFTMDNRVSTLYLSDDLFEALYKGEDGDLRYAFETRYVVPESAPYTALYVPAAYIDNAVAAAYAVEDDDATVLLVDPLYDAVLAASETMQAYFLLFLIAGCVLGAFALLLLGNFISASIAAQKREIGVLRALGARTADVFAIFLVEGVFVALVCALLCFAAAPILCGLLNVFVIEVLVQAPVRLFVFGPLSALLVLLCALLAAAVATAVPVGIYSRRSPAQGIRA